MKTANKVIKLNRTNLSNFRNKKMSVVKTPIAPLLVIAQKDIQRNGTEMRQDQEGDGPLSPYKSVNKAPSALSKHFS